MRIYGLAALISLKCCKIAQNSTGKALGFCKGYEFKKRDCLTSVMVHDSWSMTYGRNRHHQFIFLSHIFSTTWIYTLNVLFFGAWECEWAWYSPESIWKCFHHMTHIIWVMLNDSYLEMTENGTSDSNEFASGGCRCLRFSFVEKLGHVMYQNLKFVHFRSSVSHFRSMSVLTIQRENKIQW